MEILKKENVVTCFYCEYHELLYTNDDKVSIFDKSKGICHMKNIDRRSHDDICNSFVLRAGIYTQKWYPGKKGKY